MPSVFEDVGDLGVAVTVSTRLRKANLHIVIALPVELYAGGSQSGQELTCRAGLDLCASADNTGEIGSDPCLDNFGSCVQDSFGHAILV